MHNSPPDEVPDGLTAGEYQRLVILYTLMGRQAQAIRAQSFLSELEKRENAAVQDDAAKRSRISSSDSNLDLDLNADSGSDSGSGSGSNVDSGDSGGSNAASSQPSFQMGQEAGLKFAETFMRLLGQMGDDQSGAGERESESAAERGDPLAEMKAQLREIGVPEVQVDECLTRLQEVLRMMNIQERPPREVPEGLSASEYFELAQRYKLAGWTEQARDSLNFAIELDGDGEYGRKAMRFLRSKIPRYPVPLVAEQLNIQGFNQMHLNELEAAHIFEQLIQEYPDFEWPYGNLGSLLIKRSQLARAEELLIKSVQINPYYINGWLHLARVYAVQSRFAEADNCLNRVADIDPDEPSWHRIGDLIKQLKNES